MVEVETEAVKALKLQASPLQAESEEVAYVLSYDFEITCLINEGIVRPGMVPSSLKAG